MDPFTIALATFGIQKLRGKSTNRALRDAALAGGIGQFAGMAGVGPFQAFGSSINTWYDRFICRRPCSRSYGT
jgi:hypothetical protein